MKLRSVFSACSARSSHWCCSCSNFALVTGSAAASAAAAHLRANCRRYSVRALIQSNRRGLLQLQGRHCLFRCGAERAACLAHSPRTGITKEGPFSFKPRTHQRFGSLVPIDAADQCDTGSQISSERVPCFAVQYSTSPQKRSKEGGRALSVEAPLGMSMEMLTFDTNLGGYRTDITEQQIRGAPAFSRDQTSTNVEAFA